MNRRTFLAAASGTIALPALLKAAPALPDDEFTWRNPEDWGVEGKGFTDTSRYYDRLPARAEVLVREPVWNLSRHSAGMTVRFRTNSTTIRVKYALFSDRLGMAHMPPTGVSGIDLYAGDGVGMERWVSVVRPDNQMMEANIAKDLLPGSREYTMYLPLYNGVDSLEIGVLPGSDFAPIRPRDEKPIVFYGTSIMHGACASRPGMAFPAILGRRLHRPHINLAFSGNGRMEPEVGALLAELDPVAFVVDCAPNMDEEMISERAVPLVRQLRDARPDTPILLVEDRAFTNSEFFPARTERHRTNRIALRKVQRTLVDDGMTGLYYLKGDHLLGEDGEGATDGSHPNDLGMMRYADAYEPVLSEMLGSY